MHEVKLPTPFFRKLKFSKLFQMFVDLIYVHMYIAQKFKPLLYFVKTLRTINYDDVLVPQNVDSCSRLF